MALCECGLIEVCSFCFRIAEDGATAKAKMLEVERAASAGGGVSTRRAGGKGVFGGDYTNMPDGSLEISWEDWRDYLILSPHVDSLTDVLRYWRHATVSLFTLTLILKFV